MQQCAGDIYSAALTARQLSDLALKQSADIKDHAQLINAAAQLTAPYAVKCGAAFKVVCDAELFIQHGILKNNAQFPLYTLNIGVNIGTAYFHSAAVFFKLAADDISRRRLRPKKQTIRPF